MSSLNLPPSSPSSALSAPVQDFSLSFEVFPPKTEAGVARLRETVGQLADWQPRFVSVTSGADGSAIDGTLATVRDLRAAFPLAIAPHIPMSRASRPQLRDLLNTYKTLGIHRVVAIRGDAPKIPTPEEGEDYYPTTVEFVADLAHQFGFEPFVAAYPDVHPLASSPQQDIDHLKRKIDAGATCAITQLFFEPANFLRFRDKAVTAGIKVPIIPGIMPLHNLEQVLKFALGCGAAVPEGFAKNFVDVADNPDGFFNKAVTCSLALCRTLRQEGVAGFHFYTLNRSEMVATLCRELELTTNTAVQI